MNIENELGVHLNMFNLCLTKVEKRIRKITLLCSNLFQVDKD